MDAIVQAIIVVSVDISCFLALDGGRYVGKRGIYLFNVNLAYKVGVGGSKSNWFHLILVPTLWEYIYVTIS